MPHLHPTNFFLLAAESAPPITPANGLFLLVVLFIVTLAVLYPVITRRRRRQSSSPVPPPISGRTREDGLAIQRTADKALVDLVETGREISAQIDTKIRILNKLTKDADRQSRRLEKLLNIASDEKIADGSAHPQDAPLTPSGRWRSTLHTQISALHTAGRSIAEIAQETRLSTEDVEMVLHLLSQAE